MGTDNSHAEPFLTKTESSIIMNKQLKIRDITLRDGQQSLFATRMTQAQIDRVLPLYKDAGFFSMEVWGGAVPDSVMRYLNEDPWERLEKIKSVIGDTSKLSALSRGRNLFGYNPYPDQVLEGFYKHSIETGIGIMRIFDALNDTVNVASSIKFVKQYGGIPDCAVCYTIDPKIRKREAFLSLITGKHLPPKVFTMEYFAKKVQELERMGAEMITIKDMAGLIPPMKSGLIIKLIKEHTSVPITFHTHSTPGYGLASMLTAILNGVDIVDTCILNFAGGPAGPSFELVQIFCNKLGIKTGVNLQVVAGINRELKEIRKELEEFDTYKIFPIDFDISQDALPPAIDALFDAAIDYARQRNEKKLIACTQAIEQYFNFPPPDEIVRTAEIPGGMYTNMLAQLKQLKLEQLLPRVLELVPKVRVNAGCPPLVTPTSQIIGSQAVNCVIDENNGKPFYTTNSVQFVNLVKGLYGKTPVAIDPEFRKKICGTEEETSYNVGEYKKPENPVLAEFGHEPLARNEKEELLLELFPNVAHTFLFKKAEKNYMETIRAMQEEKRMQYESERAEYEKLTPEEREKRLQEGLYGYTWTSFNPS